MHFLPYFVVRMYVASNLGCTYHAFLTKNMFDFTIALKPRTTGGHQLVPVGTLPLWWSFKLQQDEMLRRHGTPFNTDSLDLCQLYFFFNGTCYNIIVGSTVKISHTTVDSCQRTRFEEEEEKEEEEEEEEEEEPQFFPLEEEKEEEKEEEEEEEEVYGYRSSTYGTQTYQSTRPCSSFASHREIHFEIADVWSQNAASLLSASSVVVSECRITLRLAVDVPNKKTYCTGNDEMDLIDWPDKHDHTLYIVPLLQAPGKFASISKIPRCSLHFIENMLTGRHGLLDHRHFCKQSWHKLVRACVGERWPNEFGNVHFASFCIILHDFASLLPQFWASNTPTSGEKLRDELRHLYFLPLSLPLSCATSQRLKQIRLDWLQ